MKLNGISSNTLVSDHSASASFPDHSQLEPARLKVAAEPETKKEKIAFHFAEIMRTMGLDLADDSLRDTPSRVAKMYVDEVFRGLDQEQFPSITLFDNSYGYGEMLLERNIKVHSMCEHHFVPIIGRAHVAYLAKNKVVGLSKLNRIVDHFARRPQVQERLTVQIADCLSEVLETEDVAVYIEADHMCVKLRGVCDHESDTITSALRGQFTKGQLRREFYDLIKSK